MEVYVSLLLVQLEWSSLAAFRHWEMKSFDTLRPLEGPPCWINGIVPDLYGRTQTRKSGFTDVSFVIQQELWQDGVPNISARILANAGGYTDICDCLCSYNTCSGKDISWIEIWLIWLHNTREKDLFTCNCECLHVQHSVPTVLNNFFFVFVVSNLSW